jgi:hypothetical protein
VSEYSLFGGHKTNLRLVIEWVVNRWVDHQRISNLKVLKGGIIILLELKKIIIVGNNSKRSMILKTNMGVSVLIIGSWIGLTSNLKPLLIWVGVILDNQVTKLDIKSRENIRI